MSEQSEARRFPWRACDRCEQPNLCKADSVTCADRAQFSTMQSDIGIPISGMVEAIALAIGQKLIEITPDDCSGVLFTGGDIRELAKAALSAMREPNFAMMEAGLNQDGSADSWRAMIDAAGRFERVS